MSGSVGSGNALAWLGPADFTQAIAALLPRGLAWEGPLMAQLVEGSAEALASFHAFLAQITEIEMVPETTDQLLPDWELDFGLPDCCSPLAPTVPQRIAALLAKMQALGGQSQPYFIALAATLGFTVTITKFDITRFGARFGSRFYTKQWRFIWQMNVPGPSSAGAELICRISDYQPAAGKVLFNFTG